MRLFNEGLTPVARSRSRPNWVRLHEDQVFYYRSPDHGFRYVLSIAFRFSSHDDEHQFALFYVYNYSTLNNFLNRWTLETKRRKLGKFACVKPTNLPCASRSNQSRQSPNLSSASRRSPQNLPNNQHLSLDVARRDQTRSPSTPKSSRPSSRSSQIVEDIATFRIKKLATSILSKSIYLVEIGNCENFSPRDSSVVIVTCRLAGNLDSSASLVCQGIVDFLMSDTSISNQARKIINFFIFPMIDPDSVWTGNSSTDILGQAGSLFKLKFNDRLYSKSVKIEQFLEDICKQANRVILLNLRVNLNLIGSRIVGTYYHNTSRMERHLSLPRSLAKCTADFYLESCTFKQSDVSSSSSLNPKHWPNLDQYRLEISPFAAYKLSASERNFEEYDQFKYLMLGKAIVFALLDIWKPKDCRELPSRINDVFKLFHQPTDGSSHLKLCEKEHES